MKTKLILFFAFAFVANLAARALDQNLVIPEITVPSGSVGYFQIDLEDDETTVAFGGDIDIPDDFAFLPNKDMDNEIQYVLNFNRNNKLTFESNNPYNNNDRRIILMTSDVSCITGKTGWLLKLPFTTNVAPGTYEARMHSLNLTTVTYQEDGRPKFNDIEIPDITVKITVTEPEDIRYGDNQLFCNDIEINQGENAELTLYYNSTSDVYEYSADVVLPSNVTVNGEVTFSSELTAIGNFTNNSTWDASVFKLTVSGEYGGRRADPAPAGKVEVATIKLNTASLSAGEYEIKIVNQILSNDDDDYIPETYIGKLIVIGVAGDEQCETPTISIVGNQLYVHSDTEGAVYHTSIVAYDHKDVEHGEEPIELGGQCLITTYASADGYADSEPATAMIVWNKKDVITGTDEIEMGTDRMLLLQSVSDNIVISGITAKEPVALYELAGKLLFQSEATADKFTIRYQCTPGQIYIVQVGTASYKYRF